MASSPGRVARIGPIWASSLACRATVFGGEYGVKYLVVHCAPRGNLRPVVGIALQEARGRRARGGVGVTRAAGSGGQPAGRIGKLGPEVLSGRICRGNGIAPRLTRLLVSQPRLALC
jgi:hypothetical protein